MCIDCRLDDDDMYDPDPSYRVSADRGATADVSQFTDNVSTNDDNLDQLVVLFITVQYNLIHNKRI